MVLNKGDGAPPASAPNQHGEEVTVDLDGPTVLYFYPRDDTPGCTIEANQFEREREVYEEAGVTVYGVSTDGIDSHAAFCEDQGITFDLLADPDASIIDAYGIERRQNAAARTTVVIIDGEIHRVYEGVDPDGHAREVLMDLLEEGVVDLPE